MSGRTSLPTRLRIVYDVGGAVALAVVYRATRSDGLQMLTLLCLVLFVPRVLTSIAERRGVTLPTPPDRVPSWRAAVASAVFAIAWTALVLFRTWNPQLGPWFWFWILFTPVIEAVLLFTRIDIARHGGKPAPPPPTRKRVVRASVLAGIATVPMIFLIMRYSGVGETAGASLFTGLLCGCIVFCISFFAQRPETSHES